MRARAGSFGWWKLATIAIALAIAIGSVPADVVERLYSHGFYPWLQPRLTAISNGTSVPLLDIAAIAVLFLCAVWWCVRLRRAGRGRLLRTIMLLMYDSAAVAAVIYLWFLAGWGMNYRRQPLRNSLDFHDEQITPVALRALATRTIEEMNVLYPEASRESWPLMDGLGELVRPGFMRAQQQLGLGWKVVPARPKRSLLNFYFTRAAVDGMTDPFFLETLVNQNLLPFEQPFVIAHEWAHLAGYADESEANFMGWLACVQGGTRTRYSAWLSLYGTVISALPVPERPGITQALQPGPRRDLRALADRIARQSVPAARRAGNAVYDRFLKANRVDAGIESYSEVVRLLLGTRFTKEDVPVLRKGG